MVLSSHVQCFVTVWLKNLETAKNLLVMIIQSSSHSHYLKSERSLQLPCEAKAISLCLSVQDS